MQGALRAVAAVLAVSMTCPAQAQDWPTRPVRIVSPFAPGGGSDTVGRVVADYLSERLGQQFFIENRGGAGGVIGSAAVAKAPPDGYTFVISSIATHVIAPITVADAGYDPLRDFAHVAFAGGPPTVVVVHPSLGVKSFKELIALSKSKPEPNNVGTPGAGSLGQLTLEAILQKKIANFNHVPYRGGAPLLTDFFGNHIPVASTPILPILQHAAAGTIVPLGVTSTQRIPLLKDVPTFQELGYPEMNGAIWFWLAGPKNPPAPIVDKLNQEIRRLINSPEIREQFEKTAVLSMDADGPALTKYLAEEVKRWSAFVDEKGLKK